MYIVINEEPHIFVRKLVVIHHYDHGDNFTYYYETKYKNRTIIYFDVSRSYKWKDNKIDKIDSKSLEEMEVLFKENGNPYVKKSFVYENKI